MKGTCFLMEDMTKLKHTMHCSGIQVVFLLLSNLEVFG